VDDGEPGICNAVIPFGGVVNESDRIWDSLNGGVGVGVGTAVMAVAPAI
jgi:hypothetical protein